ncbi:MAG: hypothetical protein NT178_14280 [Proteobacteria bacterium]|nr:hypothetical protein [Pseudomonadota bacterium]
MNLPAAELRGIRGMGNMIIYPHPRIKYGAGSAVSRKGRGNVVAPKQSFKESID